MAFFGGGGLGSFLGSLAGILIGSAGSSLLAPKAPKLPTPEPEPKAPTASDPEVQRAMDRRRRAAASGGGRASTIKTSPQGLASTKDTEKKSLLGA